MRHNDYGLKKSIEREKLKEQQKATFLSQKGKPKPLIPKEELFNTHTEIVPNMDIYPLHIEEKEKLYMSEALKPEIEWDTESMVENSAALSERLSEEESTVYLNMGTGTGKTSTAVKTLGVLQQYLGEKVPFIVTSKLNVIKSRNWERTIKQWNKDNPDNTLEPILIDTVDRLANLIKHPTTFKKLKKLLGTNGVLICDEVHVYKSPTSKRSKQLHKLRKFRKLGLSSTLLTNNIALDMGSYLIIANKYKNKTDYMKQSGLYLYESRFGLNIYNDDFTIDKSKWTTYNKILNQYQSLVYSPDTTMIDKNLPEVKKHIVQLPHSEKMAADMRSLSYSLKAKHFDSYIDYYMSFVERLHTDDIRLNKLIEIISKDNVKQPLVFFQNTVVRDAIVAKLKQFGIEDFQEISGSSKPFHEFNHDNLSPVLVQYVAGSEGIEFKSSNTTIFFQHQRRSEILIQARGRNCRRGMKGKVDHYYLLSDDVNDRFIYDISEQRIAISNEIQFQNTFEKNLKGLMV
ncbi:DEAD/DEAH box helicase family protein [Staphylococcus agnetis]|uniref:DEAD/DEAH box helicase family protein n=1 Tax=Staphylococcus agnetis TaxID=985762 RepID=UPI00208E7031|nr:DEAD/DEAH box helicase family protein [Staphylococcus agnetis]MCO4346312.1 DEAD/DEAH box helicase family protein [Staphylococcus agnetis]MCO4360612.1 DEAD/DEAH box helicase family protein [Staphylococcus agnetis]